MKIAHFNMRSMVPKIEFLRRVVSVNDYDIIAITETWLTNNISNNTVSIDNYKFYRLDRSGRGGGVGLYVKNNICSQKIEIQVQCSEQLWVSCKANNVKPCVGVVYRPPDYQINNFCDLLDNVLSFVVPQYEKAICLGDFNVNMLDIESGYVERLNMIFETFHLKQIIDTPTTFGNNSQTLLDLIITDEDNNISNIEVVKLSRDISDHCLIQCNLQIKKIKNAPKYITYRDFKHFSLENFFNRC